MLLITRPLPPDALLLSQEDLHDHRRMMSRMAMLFWIRIVVSSDSNVNINNDTKRSLQVVRFLVPEEVSNHENCQDKYDDVEKVKVKVHWSVEAPPDKDNKRAIEE